MISLSGIRMLVVDDEEMLREVFAEALADSGALVTTAKDGSAAFELVLKQKFDAVVSDVRMPNGDGVMLARQIREKINDKPILFLCTGYSDITQAQAASLGVCEVLSKPIDLNYLLRAVSTSCEANRKK